MRRTILTGLLVLLGAATALAGGASEHRVAGHKDLGAGTLDGLMLGADGIIRVGAARTAVKLDAPTAWSGLIVGEKTWIGTGNEAHVLRVDGKGAVKRIATGDGGLMVTALAALPDDGVAAAVFPGGRIVKIDKSGAVTPFARVPAEFVWALSSDKRGALTVASGAPGAVFAIDPFGAVEKLTGVHDEHARCMTTDGDRLLIGTAPKGLVLEWRGKQLRVLRDLAAQEVVGIGAYEDGALVVAANADQVGGNAQQMAMLLKQVATPRKTDANQKPAKRAALQDGSVLLLDTDGGSSALWEQKKTAVLGLAMLRNGNVIVGTHPDGRVLNISREGTSSVIADVEESEASVVLGDFPPEVVTSNPAVLHRFTFRSGGDPGGTWTSAPLDPGGRAQWGALRVWGRGIQHAHFRSGETKEPDETWTDWTPSGGFDGERGATGVTARYLQIRVTLKARRSARTDASELRAVEVVRRTPNAAPKITDFKLSERKPDPKTGMLNATPIRKLEWKVQDPDKDRLRTTLRAQRDGSPRWATLIDGEVLGKTNHSWDTTGWPDGRYRVELVVSDAPDNPSGRAREARETLPSVRIDNTPPRVVLDLRAGPSGTLILAGDADDGAQGRLRWARLSVDGQPWQQMAARDGLFDTNKESFDATLETLAKGPHDVVVQVADTEGNLGSAAAVVDVK